MADVIITIEGDNELADKLRMFGVAVLQLAPASSLPSAGDAA